MKHTVIIKNSQDAQAQEVPKAKGATIQILFGPDDVESRFFTRRFRLEPGGQIPAHKHQNTDHQQYVLEGEMDLQLDGRKRVVRAGDAVYIPAGTVHSYENAAKEPVSFLCIIPSTREFDTQWVDETS